MTGLQRVVEERLGLPVVDGVGAAVKLAESLMGLGLTTSRAGGYEKPLPKERRRGRPADRPRTPPRAPAAPPRLPPPAPSAVIRT
ncbi:hypothetical protein FHS34_006839 [Streptomyces echinatus]|uniref:Uncharacterized protein n=1 Tax=Streptomyces echinatus TaxID=67293 RepID=A0A7W9Q0E7_9ACTN|nr:hypothetical protein [Streptomyces echinatus]